MSASSGNEAYDEFNREFPLDPDDEEGLPPVVQGAFISSEEIAFLARAGEVLPGLAAAVDEDGVDLVELDQVAAGYDPSDEWFDLTSG